jgi:hypothetical protein
MNQFQKTQINSIVGYRKPFLKKVFGMQYFFKGKLQTNQQQPPDFFEASCPLKFTAVSLPGSLCTLKKKKNPPTKKKNDS